MEHFPYLFAAYAIVWVALCLYLVTIDRRSRRAERELEDLKKIVEGSRKR